MAHLSKATSRGGTMNDLYLWTIWYLTVLLLAAVAEILMSRRKH